MKVAALMFALALSAADTASCSRTASSPPLRPPSATDPTPSGVPLTGREKISWEQQVGAGTKVEDYTFFVEVDGIKGALPGVQCQLLRGSRHHICEAPLPLLTPGKHILRVLAARTVDGGQKTSAPSEPLVVVRTPSPGG